MKQTPELKRAAFLQLLKNNKYSEMTKNKKILDNTKYSLGYHSGVGYAGIKFVPYGDEITRLCFIDGDACCIKTEDREDFLSDLKALLGKYKLS